MPTENPEHRALAERLMARYYTLKIFMTAYWGTLLFSAMVVFLVHPIPLFGFIGITALIFIPFLFMYFVAEKIARRAKKLYSKIDAE